MEDDDDDEDVDHVEDCDAEQYGLELMNWMPAEAAEKVRA